MTTIAFPQSTYSEILRRQARTDATVARLQVKVDELSHDEVKPGVAKMLEKQSRLLDAGNGIKIKDMKEYRAFVRSL